MLFRILIHIAFAVSLTSLAVAVSGGESLICDEGRVMWPPALLWTFSTTIAQISVYWRFRKSPPKRRWLLTLTFSVPLGMLLAMFLAGIIVGAIWMFG